MRKVYPCILSADEVGYSVIFPDIAGATQGNTLYDAIYMAEKFAAFAVSSMLEDGEEIPEPTPIDKINLEDGEFVTLIKVDTDEYRKSLEVSR